MPKVAPASPRPLSSPAANVEKASPQPVLRSEASRETRAAVSRFEAPTHIQAPRTPRSSDAQGRAIGFMSDEALRNAPKEEKVELMKALLSDFVGGSDVAQTQNMRQAVTQLVLGSKTAGELDYLLSRVDADQVTLNLAGSETKRALKHIAALHQATPGDWAGYRSYLEETTGAKPSGKNSLDFLVDGAEFSPKALEVFKGAKQSINVSVFQLQPDAVGQTVIDTLVERAKAGVKVRLMVDELGTMGENPEASKAMFARLRAAGGEVIIKKAPVLRDNLDHRKVFVVDGAQAFTGGMNLGRHYQVDWHDQQTLVRGPAVGELQTAFFEHWAREGGSVPAGAELQPYFNPDSEFVDGAQTYVVKHQGDKKDKNIKLAYLKAFNTAEKSITLANPYLADADVIKALCNASKRGVKVQVILPAENDVKMLQLAARGYYPDLLKAGVEVYEYHGRMAHQKVGVIDGTWATVGSSNLDARSLEFNDEMNLVVLDEKFASGIQSEMFDVDLKESTRITQASPGLSEKLNRFISPFL